MTVRGGTVRKLSEEGVERINLKTPVEIMRRIDAWRRKQPHNPNRSRAMRELIVQALDAAEGKGKKPGGKHG
jgi:hypothetical protein